MYNDIANKLPVTAGPTREYIDPVRFITNKSSGKQGYEIAKSLSRNGYQTTLISGPTNLEIENEINVIKVETAEEMFKETQKNLPEYKGKTVTITKNVVNKTAEPSIKEKQTEAVA